MTPDYQQIIAFMSMVKIPIVTFTVCTAFMPLRFASRIWIEQEAKYRNIVQTITEIFVISYYYRILLLLNDDINSIYS